VLESRWQLFFTKVIFTKLISFCIHIYQYEEYMKRKLLLSQKLLRVFSGRFEKEKNPNL